jgi:hypothetical protein
VIVATSEPLERLDSWLSGTDTAIVNAAPFLLKPV